MALVGSRDAAIAAGFPGSTDPAALCGLVVVRSLVRFRVAVAVPLSSCALNVAALAVSAAAVGEG